MSRCAADATLLCFFLFCKQKVVDLYTSGRYTLCGIGYRDLATFEILAQVKIRDKQHERKDYKVVT